MVEKAYSGTGITVRYDATRCRHVAECVAGAPDVFDPSRRPWIDPDRDPDPEHVAEVVRRCPTGALHYTLADGPDEQPDPVTTVDAVVDGPLLVRGRIQLDCGSAGMLEETRAALCRCGFSENKPFCDGTHERARWRSESSTDTEPARRPHSKPIVAESEY